MIGVRRRAQVLEMESESNSPQIKQPVHFLCPRCFYKKGDPELLDVFSNDEFVKGNALYP